MDTDVIIDRQEMKRIVNECLDERGLTADILQKMKDGMDAVFAALEADMHNFSSRPCGTCNHVTAVLGRKFGCAKLYGTRG